MKPHLSRREFIHQTAAAGAIVGASSFGILSAAPAGKTVKIAVIGCGGRGNGAIKNCIAAGKEIGCEIKLVGCADAFKDKAEKTGAQHGVSADKCFGGYDGYKKLLESTDAELMLIAGPPGFRPLHFEACINAGKHVFTEKPVGVDAPGIRHFIAVGEKAKEKNLGVVAGTQRRHQKVYLQNFKAISEGAIGTILGGVVMWNGRIPWIKPRLDGQNDADYMAMNWLNFAELSGDHITEQHVHNLDVANWFLGRPPVMASGFGGRARRKTGNQFDFFSIDYDYGDGVHIHSQCRQIAGTYQRVGEFFRGTEGEYNGKIESKKSVTLADVQGHDDPYVQEHIDLLKSIFANKPLNEARQVAESTLTAVMGRISAYTGQVIRWVDLMENKQSPYYNFACAPAAIDFERGTVKAPPDDVIPIPGTDEEPRKKKKG